ncbi:MULTISPECIES: CCA tRNA nucleotidyltransferase [unclassified Exiguobacterium]|uniref:CCA tRNA nucleotidyltransferase n=1 Tax=unclassified Exiguobacterium TaxID=2644629 RepID=UPI001BEB58A2|nr:MULTISPECIES: CCA tRNA nucleotidyltransferase [unclassified Exiguobacterium]
MTEWEYAKQIIETIERHGGEAYIVGGAVRDYVLGSLPDDIDLATSLFPEEVMALFPKSVPTGIEHGTVTVIIDHHPFEVTTFRSEGAYSDSRRPDHVALGVSLEEDLLRRDFTMNAMAFHDGQVVDLFGGQHDLEERIIRTVGSPFERFGEDALRIMRALRFMSQLDFTLHEELRDAASVLGHKLEQIAMERIAIEFEKLLVGPAYKRALNEMVALGIHRHLPGVTSDLMNRVQEDERTPVNAASGWALFLYHSNDESWLLPWKRSNAIKREARTLAKLCETGLDEMTIYQTEETTLSTYFRMNGERDRSRELKQSLPIQSRKELQFDGRDALELGAKGEVIKHMLADLERRVVLQEMPNHETVLKEEAKRWLQRAGVS